jgi:hypothetical protein
VSPAPLPGMNQAIVTTVNGKGDGNFNISNNGTAANPITNFNGNVIANSALGTANVTTTIANNYIVANHRPDFGGPLGISVGSGQTTGIGDTARLSITVSGNHVSKTDSSGIFPATREGHASLVAKVINNVVGAPQGTGVSSGIRVDSGGSSAASSVNNSACLEISGNTSAGESGAAGISLRKQGTSPTVHVFGVEGMTATASPQVEAYVNGQNPNGGGTLLQSATSGFTNCNVP